MCTPQWISNEVTHIVKGLSVYKLSYTIMLAFVWNMYMNEELYVEWPYCDILKVKKE